MSFNQSKSDKNESQYRKPGGGGRSGSSGQQRTFTGNSGRGGGGSTAPPLVTNPSSLSSSRSFKKTHNAGVQSRVVPGSVNAANTAPLVQNGSHSQHTHPAVSHKPNDMANQRNNAPIPRAPTQSSAMTSDSTTTPTTPAKGDGAKGFSLQFGSISPGLMNGMQVPARTTSAPPNIAELKRDQAQHAAALKVAAAVPPVSVPKTQLPRNDVPNSNAALKPKRDPPVTTSALPPSQQPQKPPVLPMAQMPIQVPYHQPPISLQFGGPNPQIQSQGLPTSSLSMPIQISLQSQVQQQMYISGLPHNMMPPQPLMHQSGYNPQMHQLGNIQPQFSPQQPVKYSSPTTTRKAVKITDPKTREEVNLIDKKLDHNVPQQQQSYQSGHPIGYYPNTYTAGPQYLNPIPQQASRYNYPASQAPHNVPFVSHSPPNSLPVSRVGKVTSSNVVSSSPVLVTIKPATSSSAEKNRTNIDKNLAHPKFGTEEEKRPVSATVDEKVANETLVRSESVKDNQKKQVNKGHDQSVTQFGVQASSGLSQSAESSDHSSKTVSSSAVELNKTSSGAGQSTVHIHLEQSSAVDESSSTAVNVDLSAEQQVPLEAETSVTEKPVKDNIDGEEDLLKQAEMAEKTDIKLDLVDTSVKHVAGDKIDREASKPSIIEAVIETARPTSSSGSASVSSNKSTIDSNKTKTVSTKGKKGLKQILQKADAQGTTSDLYMAYKGRDDKVESTITIVASENTSNDDTKDQDDVSVKDRDDVSKAEPDDWEDAADVSTPKLQSILPVQNIEEPGTVKKYTRDFLLTLSELHTSLPEGFKDNSDIVTPLRPNSSNSSSSPRITDRPSSGHKVDRSDRWNKHPSPREMGQDSGYGPNQMGFRSGPGGNHGVLRNPRAQQQPPVLSGPMHHSMQRNNNNTEPDRWRNINFKGLMPPPQTNMHKAERKYQVGKVTDEEQAKQRKLKGILNKLTPQNFDKLFAQVKEVNIDNVITLNGVISQIFDKALMEPTFCEMYSNFCHQLSLALPDLSVEDEKITFKRLLLNKCQEEFERGEKEEEEANKDDSGEEIKLSDAEREERRIQARRRMLGNIRLIGELYKKSMLTERIMHECIRKLLGQFPNCVEEDIESLCKLMSTIGEMIDHPRGKEYMEYYFGMMGQLSNDMKLSSRVRFMLKDAIDLRKNKWQQRRKVEGPKKIEDVHRDAAQEKHAQSSRLNRGPSMGSGTRRGQAVDFISPRGSGMLQSPVSQSGSYRGLPQGRNYAMQDVRTDSFNSSRNVSIGLPQRSLGDGSITLGPQGGLARGMSVRGQSSLLGDGLNGFSSSAREDHVQRLAPPEKFGGGPQLSIQEHVPAATPSRGQGVLTGQSTSSENVLSDERLREKSIASIREFYSAKDEKEVDTCVRELNAPRFYPSVISTWVNDSFERKDPDRVLLNKLIVNLSKTGQLFVPDQLIKGFEAVLTNLEDTVSDAPKAPEYLGRLLSMLILQNIITLKEIGVLLYEGGEEPGCLREAGLAGDVLGSILENIKSEKGESAVKDICSSSNLRLEDFRPQEPRKSKKLELFI